MAVGTAKEAGRPGASKGNLREAGEPRWWAANRSDLLILGALWLLLAGLFFWLGSGHVTPRRVRDEFFWWEITQSFAGGDGMTWRGVSEGGVRSPLYVIYLALAFLPGWDTLGTYKATHLLNALAMPAVIFPTFFIAREFVSRRWAFAAALLSVAIGEMNWVGIIGTESLAYPVATLALGATVVAVMRVERRFWIWAICLTALAALTRTQFLALFAVLPLAIILTGSLQPAGKRLRYFEGRQEPLIFLTAAIFVFVIVLAAVPEALVGIYSQVFDYSAPSAPDLAYWIANFTAGVFVMTGFAPVVATLALMLDRDNWKDSRLAALLSVSLVATVVLVLQISWFCAVSPEGMKENHVFFERYIIYLAPLFFVGLVAFFRHGRVRHVAIAAAIGAVAVLPFDDQLVLTPFSYDAWGHTLEASLLSANESLGPWIGVLLAAVTLAFGALLYWSARSTLRAPGLAWLVVFACGGFMVANQASGWTQARQVSAQQKRKLPQPVDFIDRATDAEVGMVLTAGDSPIVYYSVEFWNDRVTRAFVPPNGPTVHSPTCALTIGADGAIASPDCDRIPRAFYMRSPLVHLTFRDTEKVVEPTRGTRLVVAKAPARLAGIVANRNVISGNINGAMAVSVFAAPGSMIEATFTTVSGESGTDVSVNANDHQYRLREGKTTTIKAPVPARGNTAFSVAGADGESRIAVVQKVLLREPGRLPLDLIH